MIAIITGDIVASRKLKNQEYWLLPLKSLFNELGRSPQTWEIFRGDSFQLEVKPREALLASMRIKSLIKSVKDVKQNVRNSNIDIRMSIGIGSKDFNAESISQSNGSAFVYSGEKFENLKKEKTNLAIKTPWPTFDKEMNLYIKLALIVMDNWSINSGELMNILLKNPKLKQVELGELLRLEQNSVSGRIRRAYSDEIMDLESIYREKLEPLLK